MRVLVTGHQGYIGSVLVHQLKSHNHNVVGLDSGFFADGVLGPTPTPPDETIQKDVRHIEPKDLRNLDAIIHLAALSDDPIGELDPTLTDQINRKASTQLAIKAKEAGVARFIFSSSSSVYGAVKGDKPVDENTLPNPITAYAKSKAQTEDEIRPLADKNFTPVYLRSATAYGPSPHIRFCTLVVHNLMGNAISTGQVTVKSDGLPWRPLVHVEDIGRAFIATLEAPRDVVFNQVFNVGHNSQNFQVKDIAQTVEQTIPNAQVVYTGGHSADQRSYCVNFDKITQALNFEPKWTLKTGCEALYHFLKDNHFTDQIFNDRRYHRLKQIQHLINSHLVDHQLYWQKEV